MHINATTAKETLQAAIEVVGKGPDHLCELDGIPTPIYLTDASGTLTYFNPACVEFAGRTPSVNADNWCVTWRLYTVDGKFLPHDQCPMAVALKEERKVRGAVAVAERPDGTRIHFRPYPTPLRDKDGNLVGALNMLVGIPDRAQIDFLRRQSRRCARLASSTMDERTAGTLNLMALEYSNEADRLERLAAN